MSELSEKKQTSRCMFCNSSSYGTGCPYSPHKKHVHIVSGLNCIYCGSINTGRGCPYNPFNKLHIRGVEYNAMMKESVHKSVMAGIFLTRLAQPITEMSAYKLGLIDESGHRIKAGTTEGEMAALTPLDMHILKVRRLIGEHVVELFRSSVLLEIASSQTPEKFDADKYKCEMELNARIGHLVTSMQEIVSEGIESGFSRENMENRIIESILSGN